MQTIPTIPNSMPEVSLTVAHTLPLEGLCPATGNPQPGSEITIQYQPDAKLLDVFGLNEIIAEYTGHQHIRDIEYMLQHLTKRIGLVLRVRVEVKAVVILDLQQTMTITARFDA